MVYVRRGIHISSPHIHVMHICSTNPFKISPGTATANMHRTFQDIQASWGDIILNNLYAQVGLGKYGAPGSWNDPDFLEVCNGNLTRMQVGGRKYV